MEEFWNNLLIKIVNILGLEFKPESYPLDKIVNNYTEIHIYLLFTFIIWILLTLLFLISFTFYLNEEYINKKVNNKFLNPLIRFQRFITNISFVIYPLYIIFIIHGWLNALLYLVIHPIKL